MEYIEELLNRLPKLEPLETGITASYSRDATIKAVVFDIYGTLLVSSSGDIDQAEISTKNLAEAFEASNIKVIGDGQGTLEHILFDFEYTIKICHQEAKKNQVPHPEIDILSIWEIVLIHARRKGLIYYNGEANIMRMTCVFEFLSNKVYPMPGMKKVIQELKDKNYPLGIVSNAQFYTPVLMNYFINNKVGLDEKIKLFNPDLIVYSYKLGIGKPDVNLFAELEPVLRDDYSIKPEEVLFVGNDMLKDVYTSHKAGYKTVLFAGDRRSLRMRSDDARVKGLIPNHIITDLNQLLKIVH